MTTDSPSQTVIIPCEYKDGKTRVPLSKSKKIEKQHLAVIKKIEIKKLLRPPSYIIQGEEGQIVHKFETGYQVMNFLNSYKTP